MEKSEENLLKIFTKCYNMFKSQIVVMRILPDKTSIILTDTLTLHKVFSHHALHEVY